MARRLFPSEIDDILAYFDAFFLGLDARARAVKLKQLCDPLRAKLNTVEILPCKIGALRAEIARAYRFVEPGKVVGIVTSQSIGSGNTQATLNTFHTAGKSTRAATTGVNRFIEIITTNKSKSQQSRMTKVFIRKHAPAAELQRYLGALIYHTVSQLVTASSSCKIGGEYLATGAPSDWELFFARHNDMETQVARARVKLEYKMNPEIMYRYRITLAEILEKAAEHMEEKGYCYCAAASPLHMSTICFYLENIHEEGAFHARFLDMEVRGVKGITHAWITPAAIKADGAPHLAPAIEAEGSDLARVLQLDFVDTFYSCSNDVWEVYAIFGIEAVRQMILEEFMEIMPDVHFAHIQLLVDRMTVSGHLGSISRYTRKDENASVLSKITFEETLTNFLRAAFYEECDQVDGCSATIICGRTPRVGTGTAVLLQSE